MNCIYCGENEANTRDHIIPKQLYSKPRPNDLITVPACKECNYSFRKDEEYFRVAIAGSLQAVENSEQAEEIIKGPVSRAIERRNSLINMIKKDLKYVPVSKDNNSFYFVPGYELDKNRVDTVLKKIVRGLFYFEEEKPLPYNFKVVTNVNTEKELIPENIMKHLSSKNIKEIGEGRDVFEYIKLDVEDREFSSFWLLCFYKSIVMIAVTLSPDEYNLFVEN